ncbi:MAG TPA: hypothetical protein VMT18_15555 [Planctomycetota bacterium]|nr:hypothetical protein [Planctomycetota bacterium]
MTHSTRLCALSLALLAACGGTKEDTAPTAATVPASETASETAATAPATEATPATEAAPAARPTSKADGKPTPKGELAPGKPTPQEIVAPFVLDEALRTRAAPFDESITIDTPLVVRGKTIPTDEVKRELILGIGFAFADFKKFEIILAQELDRRQAAGEDIEQYLPSEADLAKHIEAQRADFALRYPTLDFKTEVGRAYLSYEIYLEPARQSLMFDRLFIPEDPADWPPLTIELIRGFGGDPFVQDAFDSYARRKQQMIDQGLDSIPPDDQIIVGTWRDIVLRELSNFAAIEIEPIKLPPGVLMVVDGVEIKIDDVWSIIGPHLTQSEVVTARRLLAMLTLLELDLESRGELLSREEWEALFVPEDRTLRQMLEMHANSASNLMGTQSAWPYARFDRITQSLRRVHADEVAGVPSDRAFVNNINQITGAAKLDAEFVLSSAWDGDTDRWKPNGWTDARKRSFALRAELDGGADWKELRELHSEFWDPPLPEIGHKPQFGFHFKGAFGAQTRNQLLGLLEEREVHNLIYGGTVTDRAFYFTEPGTVVGPLMGPLGYYLVKVNGRTPATSPLDMNKDSHRELVINYWLRNRAYEQARGLAAAAVAAGELEGF